ncbi:YTH domain-containing family protein 1-like isoform X2 [Iris pallida]|uniref:YTH domain-containing family protein n=1 Tax=Iris pallida TaxID=29817 RepID=A0AAX6DIK5_IRIPA|nr:YTH domain-containing family protein 1-like isoform X2 [Iris pallida]
MYTGSENVPTETYMMPGSGVNTQMTLLAPPEGLDYMANEAAPEAFFDQALYYPAANYYGYYCTGLEPQSEWEDHRFFSVDGQELNYSGFQAETYPYVYYPPNYGYAQSSYNPYNPYIPGAVIGVDGPFIGTQQYFTNPSYLPQSSPAGFIPLVLQPGSDVYNNSGGSSVHDSTAPMSSRQGNTGLKYQNQRASANRGAVSQKNTAGIPASESSRNASSSEGSVNAPSSKQSSSHGAMTSGNATQMTQGKFLSSSVQAANHFTDGRFSPVQNPSKLIAPSNNILPNYGSNIHGWATMERPRSQYHGTTNNGNGNPDILSEQNRGPRTTRTRGQWTSVIEGPQMADICATNAQGTIVIQTEQYNKADFPVDYPYAKFFVIKSYSEDDVHKSIKYNVWSSTPNGNKRLSSAYEDAQRISVGKPTRNCPIFLFFSVNASGQFCGVAEMSGPVDFHKDMDFWQQDKWNGSFPVKWHIVKDVPNTSFRHILLENNENKPVTNSRDTQEVTYVPGMNMLNIFKTSPLKTSILDDFMFYEERQKIMQQEKSRFLGRSYTSYLPAVVPMNNGNDTGEQTVSADKFKKEEGKQLHIATDQATKANDKQNIGQPPIAETTPAKDPKTSGNGGPSNEQKPTSKIDAIILSDVKEDAKPKGEDKHHLEEDANVTSSIQKMNALSIVSEEGEANCHKKTIEESSTSLDVVTVGSMHIKVNGAGEISSKTITIEPKV